MSTTAEPAEPSKLPASFYILEVECRACEGNRFFSPGRCGVVGIFGCLRVLGCFLAGTLTCDVFFFVADVAVNILVAI